MYRARQDAPDHLYPSVLWHDSSGHPWLLHVTWAKVAGRMECAGIQLRGCREAGEAWPPELPMWNEEPPVLTSSVLRELHLAEVVNDLRREFADVGASFVAMFDEGTAEDRELKEGFRRMGAAWADPPGATEGHAEVARVYLEAWRAGEAPTRAVQNRFTISYSAAAKRVSRARQAGFLPETRRGRAVGREES